MKNEDGLNQLSKVQKHMPFNLFYENEFFARFDYDEELKRYQSKYCYLTIEAVCLIMKDITEKRKIIWIGD